MFILSIVRKIVKKLFFYIKYTIFLMVCNFARKGSKIERRRRSRAGKVSSGPTFSHHVGFDAGQGP